MEGEVSGKEIGGKENRKQTNKHHNASTSLATIVLQPVVKKSSNSNSLLRKSTNDALEVRLVDLSMGCGG
jgi:hypothetical protein